MMAQALSTKMIAQHWCGIEPWRIVSAKSVPVVSPICMSWLILAAIGSHHVQMSCPSHVAGSPGVTSRSADISGA
jgi:hypothetical protein